MPGGPSQRRSVRPRCQTARRLQPFKTSGRPAISAGLRRSERRGRVVREGRRRTWAAVGRRGNRKVQDLVRLRSARLRPRRSRITARWPSRGCARSAWGGSRLSELPSVGPPGPAWGALGKQTGSSPSASWLRSRARRTVRHAHRRCRAGQLAQRQRSGSSSPAVAGRRGRVRARPSPGRPRCSPRATEGRAGHCSRRPGHRTPGISALNSDNVREARDTERPSDGAWTCAHRLSLRQRSMASRATWFGRTPSSPRRAAAPP